MEAKTQGEKNRVDFSDGLIARMRDSNEQIITHHNHPSNSALSDLGTLYHPGHDTVIAHGKDGELSAARLTPRTRKLLDPSSPASHETSLVHRFLETNEL